MQNLSMSELCEMSRPFTNQDYLLIGVVVFVIIACLISLARSFPKTWLLRDKRLAAGKNLRQVHGPNRRSRPGERSLNLHQTTRIDGNHRAGAGAQN